MNETSEYEFSDEEGLRSILEATEMILEQLEIETKQSKETNVNVLFFLWFKV